MNLANQYIVTLNEADLRFEVPTKDGMAYVLVAQLEDKVNQLNNLTTHSLKYFVEIIDQTYRHY